MNASTLEKSSSARPANRRVHETLLSKTLALPIFAGPLSSVAYATEAAWRFSSPRRSLDPPPRLRSRWPSRSPRYCRAPYVQTVRPTRRAAAHTLSRKQSRDAASLVAAAALLVDYILTVAVSVTAGVFALTSAMPSLASHKVGLSLFFILLLTVVNLRGVRESGVLFAVPTYAFVVVMFALIGTGIGKCAAGACPQAHVPDPLVAGAGTVGVLVILRAFASGAAALTGVEAISNGCECIPARRKDETRPERPCDGRYRDCSLPGCVPPGPCTCTLVPSGSVSVISEIARTTFPRRPDSFLTTPLQGLTFDDPRARR